MAITLNWFVGAPPVFDFFPWLNIAVITWVGYLSSSKDKAARSAWHLYLQKCIFCLHVLSRTRSLAKNSRRTSVRNMCRAERYIQPVRYSKRKSSAEDPKPKINVSCSAKYGLSGSFHLPWMKPSISIWRIRRHVQKQTTRVSIFSTERSAPFYRPPIA